MNRRDRQERSVWRTSFYDCPEKSVYHGFDCGVSLAADLSNVPRGVSTVGKAYIAVPGMTPAPGMMGGLGNRAPAHVFDSWMSRALAAAVVHCRGISAPLCSPGQDSSSEPGKDTDCLAGHSTVRLRRSTSPIP